MTTDGGALPDCILIDDDPLVHMTWKIAAREKGKLLRTFSSREEFLAAAADIVRSTPIYIDSNLGNAVKGETVAEELYALGYTELYLATGYVAERFTKMTWLKGVIGKEPPWA